MVEPSATRFDVVSESILANTNTVFNALSYNAKQQLTAYACANMVLV